jgi:hypothetical protein
VWCCGVGCRGTLVFHGCVYTCRISALVNTLLSLHVTLGVPLYKRLIRPLCISFELLKVLEFTFLYKLSVIKESIPPAMQIAFKILLRNVIQPVRDKLDTTRRMDDAKLDHLAALNVFESILRSTDSLTFRRCVGGLDIGRWG